ncbi:hypothetical protein [Sneathiella sp. HT1-7]|uniref:hypothetical protein n=1 Tax=Sneathiella sp. HT1-7 TaxID=2887192 RepID=UPI001D155D7D|nr:hypothetical protein [Sneathiella sp. HT1-7]MCC3305845.1 hypothetical protein [Sneathiella sp. HT1-7]
MMKLIHKGFDGLDIAFQSRIPEELAALLETAKEEAAASHETQLLDYNGALMHVAESGAQGGYAYRVDTGPDGETWFFRKPNPRDPWGIRVSVKSLSLALYGLGGVRTRLFDFMEVIGAPYPDGAESIGRVDCCLDFLIPGFQLFPEHFVMHSRCSRIDNHEMEVHGRSGRVTGVRIGKMPGRQIAIYDKRADVIAKRKAEWWEIWNANLKADGLPPIDPQDRDASQVWRVECRAGKKLLKDRWDIRKWTDLDDKLGDLMQETLSAIRYCIPSSDTNRARWPIDPLWDRVQHEMRFDLFEMSCNASPSAVKEIIRHEHAEMLGRQITGLSASYAAILEDRRAASPETLPETVQKLVYESLCRDTEYFYSKLKKAERRYVFISR